MHHCPIPGCTKKIADALLLCPQHWLAVPRSIRTEVNKTWRAFNRSMHGSRDEIAAALHAHQEASDAAIRVVTQSELPVCD